MQEDRSQIEEIKSRIDITNVIQRYVTLKKAGKNFVGLCPFHSEKTPSFTVNPTIQLYKCFGCGESGDIIKFVEKVEHMDFVEVLEKLAKETGVELKKTKKNPNSMYSKISEINEQAVKFYTQELRKTPQAMNYLKERKMNEDALLNYKIGYAPGGTKLLEHILSVKKFTPEELLATGLFTDKNGNLKDRFFQRIIFPIENAQGHTVGFTGRNLPTSDYGPKYLHTPETQLFKKSQLMYGLSQAKTHIREKELCIICEGTTDVISAHQRGVKNIVAPLGTAVSADQLALISRITKNVLLLLDNDDAGRNALERYFLLGIPLGLNLSTNSTAPHKDLDELMKTNPESIDNLISEKKDLFSYLVVSKLEKKDLDNHKDYKEIIEYVSHLISHVPDQASQEFFLKKGQQITTIDSNFFNTEKKEQKEETVVSEKHSEKVENEIFLLALVIYFEDTTTIRNLELKFLLNEEIKEILEEIKKEESWNEKSLLKKKSEVFEKAMLESSAFNMEKTKKDKYILNTYEIIKNQNIEKLIQKLKRKERISIEKQENEKIDKIGMEIMRLKKLLEK